MAIRYLGKSRPHDFDVYRPLLQMMNIPGLNDRPRCAYCFYQKEQREGLPYRQCSDKHKCGSESLIFMEMKCVYQRSMEWWWKFTPTPVTKLITIDNNKRYLQLISADIQGYECNQLCQYYPSRVAADQSIAECANSHACGRNGSFWTLTLPWYEFLETFPDLTHLILDEHTFLTFDGRVLSNKTLLEIYIDDNFWLRARLDDGTEWYIVNMYNESEMCGELLYAHNRNNTRLWDWGEHVSYHNREAQSLVFTSDEQPIPAMLQQMGMPNDNLLYRLWNLKYINLGTYGNYWFVNQYRYFNYNIIDGYQVVVIRSYLNETPFIVRFGDLSSQYLARKFEDDPAAKWVKANLPEYQPSGVQVIILNAITDPMAQWLMEIGVRQSLFFFK